MFAILAACRLCGWAVRRWLRQPQVIGEMIAGVMLGPSLLGAVAPDFQRVLFPPESQPLLHVVAQLGIAIYMFLVGLDFRGDEFRSHVRGAVAVSLASSPHEGLDLLAPLAGELSAYAPFHLARADMLRRTGQLGLAREAYRTALDLTQNAIERDFILDRITALGAP